MKTFFRFLSLAAAVLLCHSVSAQTVTATAGGQSVTYTASQLRTGLLADKTRITIQGTWSLSQIDSLSASLHSSFNWATFNLTGNDKLESIDMRNAAFTGDSISLEGTFYSCSQLRDVTFPASNFNGKVSLVATFMACSRLESVNNIDKLNGIRNMSSTFFGCSRLEVVSFSANTNNNSISFGQTFSQCTRLQRVENLNQFTRITNLMSAFDGCESLTEIQFHPSLKYIGNEYCFSSAFRGCKSLRRIDNLDSFVNMMTTGALSFLETFKDCSQLDSIRLHPDASHLISLNQTFNGCSNLRKFNSGDLVFTTLDHAFKGCAKLEEFVCHPNSANHDKLVDMSSAFSGCSSLKIPSSSAFCYQKIYGIDSCFYQCGNLEEVRFTTPQAYWMPAYSTFDWCYKLRHVYGFENFTNLNSLRRTFAKCYQLEEVRLGVDPNQLSSRDLEDTFYSPNSAHTMWNNFIPSSITLYAKIEGPGCVKYLPNGVTTVPTQWINYGYKNFVVPITITANKTNMTMNEGSGLNSALSENGITISVSPDYANIDSIYWEISSYGTHEEWDPVDAHYCFSRYDDQGRLMLYVFNGKTTYTKEFSVNVNAKALVCYDRNGNVTYSLANVPEDEYDLNINNVSNAYKIYLGGTWSDLQMNYVFNALSYNPENLREFNAYWVSASEPVTYYNAFKNCVNLTKVTLPSGGKVGNMYAMFENCTQLTYVDLSSNSWGKNNMSIHSAFRNCTSLKTVILPGMPGGTDNTRYFRADSAFMNCNKLQRIYHLEYIVKYTDMTAMFKGCSSLEDLHLGMDVSTLAADKSQNTFDGVPNALIKWLPASCPDVPQAWKGYKNFVLPLHITLTGSLQAIRNVTNFTQGLSAGAVYTIGPSYAYIPQGDSNFAVGVYPNNNPSSSAVFPDASEVVSDYAGNGSYVNVWWHNGNDWYASNLIPVRMNDTWSIKVRLPGNLGVFEGPKGLRLFKGDGEYWYGTRDLLDFDDATLYGDLSVAGWLNDVTEIEGRGTWNDNMIRHLRWGLSGMGYSRINQSPKLQTLDLSYVTMEATTDLRYGDIWSPLYPLEFDEYTVVPSFKGKLTASFDSLCYVDDNRYRFDQLTEVALPYNYSKPAGYDYDVTVTEVSLRLAFANCPALTRVRYLDNIRYVSDLYHTFSGCSALQEVDLHNLYQEAGRGPKSMEECFANCTSLENVTIGAIGSLSHFLYGREYFCSLAGAFKNCPALEYVQIYDTEGKYTSVKPLSTALLSHTWDGSDQCTKFVRDALDSEIPQSWKDQGYHNFVITPLTVDIKGYNLNRELNDYVLHIDFDSNLDGRYEYTVSPAYAWAEPHLRIKDRNGSILVNEAGPETPTPDTMNHKWLLLDVRDWYNTSFTDQVEMLTQGTSIEENRKSETEFEVKVWVEGKQLYINNAHGQQLQLTDLQGRVCLKTSQEGLIRYSTDGGVFLLQNLSRATTQKVLVP